MPTDRELADAAVARLKETTVGYRNKYWTTPPQGSHWDAALDYLAQIGVVTPPPPPPPPTGPITITQGGTYTGSWPSVTIATSAPVVIENSFLEGSGHLLASSYSGAQVTVRRTVFKGPANGYNRAIRGENFKTFVVENCSIERTGGIYFLNASSAASIRVARNKMKNVQGDATGNKRQFVQFNGLSSAVILCEWNEIINIFGESVSEDVFSVYQTSNVTIRNNYIQGGYPATAGGPHQGTGIILGDGGGSNNLAEKNQIVGVTNVGMGISGGNNNRVINNTVVSDGKTPSGQILAAANNGIVCYTSQWGTPTNAVISGNKIGYMQESSGTLRRVDYWTPNASNNVESQNTFYYGNHTTPITKADEDAEWPIWLAKLAANGITVGA